MVEQEPLDPPFPPETPISQNADQNTFIRTLKSTGEATAQAKEIPTKGVGKLATFSMSIHTSPPI